MWLAGNGKDDGMILKFTEDGKFVAQNTAAPGR